MVRPFVMVRLLDSKGNDMTTRKKTSKLNVNSEDLEWHFNEELLLPLMEDVPRGLRFLKLEFKLCAGNGGHIPSLR